MILTQVASDGAPGEAHLLRDQADRLTLSMTLADLLETLLSWRRWFGLLASYWLNGIGRNGFFSRRPFRFLLVSDLRRRGLTGMGLYQGGCDGLEFAAVGLEEAFEHFADILEQVPTIGHLHRLRNDLRRCRGVRAGVVSTEDLNPRMRPQPLP